MQQGSNINIVIFAHYYPPINSSGAKRFQYLSKYWADSGHSVSVVTTKKTSSDGDFTESVPDLVNVVELDAVGRISRSVETSERFVPLFSDKPSIKRRVKDIVMDWFGQIPDPRLPFAFSFLSPFMPAEVKLLMSKADIVIATSPPWSMLLAGLFVKWRFKKPCILDYRDQFSRCHEMPGNKFAKKIEELIDRFLVKYSDHVVTVSEPMSQYYSDFTDSVSVVKNGYDSESMEHARSSARLSNEDKITIRYMGIVSPGRIPKDFIESLYRLSVYSSTKLNKIKVQFYGNASLVKSYISDNFKSIGSVFEYYDFVPYHKSLELMIESDYLLFSETSDAKTLSSQGILTTKLFEYLGSGRPVIGNISISTLPGRLIEKCGGDNIVSNDPSELFEYISADDFYIRKKDFISSHAEENTRKSQSEHYAEIIEGIIR